MLSYYDITDDMITNVMTGGARAIEGLSPSALLPGMQYSCGFHGAINGSTMRVSESRFANLLKQGLHKHASVLSLKAIREHLVKPRLQAGSRIQYSCGFQKVSLESRL